MIKNAFGILAVWALTMCWRWNAAVAHPGHDTPRGVAEHTHVHFGELIFSFGGFALLVVATGIGVGIWWQRWRFKQKYK